jgi:hypothetical protein
MMGGVRKMALRDLGMVSGLVMIARFVMLCGVPMMLCGVFVVFGGLAVVLSGFFRHRSKTSDQTYERTVTSQSQVDEQIKSAVAK